LSGGGATIFLFHWLQTVQKLKQMYQTALIYIKDEKE